MSDGPHRSLPMNRAWRRAAERAESCNFDPNTIANDITDGVARDFQELLPDELIKRLKRMANELQSVLSGGRSDDLQYLHRLAAGSPLATLVVQNLEMSLSETNFPSDAAALALENSFSIWRAERIRQIEEHYLCDPRGSFRDARQVRTSLEAGAVHSSPDKAIAITLGQKKEPIGSKLTGLDEFAP